MKNPLPTCGEEFSGAYFSINFHGADVRADGIALPDGNGLTLTATPEGLAVMMTKVRDTAIVALLRFLQEGSVSVIDTALRIEVRGWGREWLIAHGFSGSQAQSAIKDLSQVGWVRTEQSPGAGVVGRQVGVLSGSIYGTGDVFLAPPRKNRQLQVTTGGPLMNHSSNESLMFPQVKALDESLVKGNPLSGVPPRRPVDNNQPAQHLGQISADESFVSESSLCTSTKYFESEKKVLKWDSILKEKPTLAQDALLVALAQPELVSAIAADPGRAVEVVAGVFQGVPPEYPVAAAKAARLPGQGNQPDPGEAPTQLASLIVACLLLDTEPDQHAVLAGLRADIRAAGIVLKDSLPDALLPRAWALALVHAGSARMSDPRRYLHAALHRKEWKTGEPLVRFAGAICALTSEPLGAQLVSSQQEQPPQELELDLIIEVLVEHFQPHPDDLHAWKGSPRRRKTIIAEFIEQTGMTPQEAARTRSEGHAAAIGESDIPSPPHYSAADAAAFRGVDADTVALVASAITGTDYDTEAGFQIVIDSPALRQEVLSRRFRDTECADWDPVQDARQIDRQQAQTA